MDFETFIAKVQDQIIDPIITVLALAAFLLFVYGVVEFIRGAEKEEAQKIGKRHMIWGIIGLAILFGANAIVKIIGNVATTLFS
jgi:hypothetical protein